LGLSVSLSEAKVHWRTFLKDQVAQGMQRVHLVISDDHARLENACPAVLDGSPGSSANFTCNRAGQDVPRKPMRKEVAEDIRINFNAPD
jgi:transposase-like protein